MNVDFADVKTVMSEMGVAIMGSGSAVGENRAREAADKAIACKLLEDINLQGARGILVNITAGADLGIAEFEEVLEIIHNIASDDALIKVGTAIDPDLDGEIKITVVATGMGGVSATEMKKAPVTAIRKPNGEVDYNALDKPTIDRVAKSSASRETRFGAQQKENTDMNFLDIPAFLRRQAD
jgi:cell division protein FtsZ